MAHFAYRKGLYNAWALLVVSLIISLISTGFVDTALGIDAFAKRKSSDRGSI